MTLDKAAAPEQPPPRPGTVQALRLLLLVPGWMTTATLLLVALVTRELPLGLGPVRLLACSGPVAVVLGHLLGPRRRTVYGLVIGYELALAVLYELVARHSDSDTGDALAVLVLPLLCLALAVGRRAWAYCWYGHQAVPHGRLTHHHAVVRTAADGAVTMDVGRRLQRQIVVGGLAAGFFGVSAMVAAFSPGPAGGRIAVGLVGTPFLLIGLVLMAGALSRRQRERMVLVLDARGISWTDPTSHSLDLAWPQVAEVRISYAHADRGGTAGAVAGTGRASRVRLLVRAATPGGDEDGVEGEGATRLIPLGDNADFVPAMDAALRRFASAAYTGVEDHVGVGLHLT